jgi:hypothetical protein
MPQLFILVFAHFGCNQILVTQFLLQTKLLVFLMFSLAANIELVVSWVREDEVGFPPALHGRNFAWLQRFKTLLLLGCRRGDGFESRCREQVLSLLRGCTSRSESQEGESGEDFIELSRRFIGVIYKLALGF